jgi:hypothetical protein
MRNFEDFKNINHWELSTINSTAKTYLCAKASQSDVESAFSVAGFIQSPHRSRLKPKTLKKLIFSTKTNYIGIQTV